MSSCPFCDAKCDFIAENLYAFSIPDRYPVSTGHSLVIPKDHVSSIFDLSADSYRGCFDLLREVRTAIKELFEPAGFNVGINCGISAGQTMPHAHIHISPRYTGDVPNPRVGVRNVMPGKGDY